MKTTSSTQQLKDLDLSIEGLGAWSHSKLKVLQNCPFQFYRKYILKIKVDGFTSPAALIGSAAHRILEFFVQGKSLTDSFAETKKEFEGQISKKDWAEKVDTLELSIADFKRRLDAFNLRYPIKKIYTELKIGVTRDFRPSTFFGKDVFFRGILDLSILLENMDVIFIDHKKGGSADFGIKVYNQQLDSQKVLFHDGVAKVSGATAGIHFIEANQLKLGDYTPRQEIEDKLRSNLIFYIDSAVEKVKDTGYFKHKAGGYCQYCEYKEECKAGALKKEELETKKIVEFYKESQVGKA